MNQLLFLILFAISFPLMAQPTDQLLLSQNEVAGVRFDEVNFREMLTTPEGNIEVYFNVKKAVRIKSKSTANLARDGWARGVAQIVLDENFESTQNGFFFFRDNFGEKYREYSILNRLSDQSPMSMESTDLISRKELDQVYPNLLPDLQPDQPPKWYYDNSLGVKTVWGKTDKIKVNKYTLESNDQPSPEYNSEFEEFELGINSHEKGADFWMPQKMDYLDEIRGYIFSLQGKVISNRVTSAYQKKSLMVITPTGEIINQFDMNSTVDQEPGHSHIYYEEINGKQKINGGLFLFQNRLKVAKKKKGVSLGTPHIKDLYEFDENGRLVQELSFETEGDEFLYFKEHWKTGKAHRFLAKPRRKHSPQSINYYASKENTIEFKHQFTLESPEFSGSNYAENWFAVYSIGIQDVYDFEGNLELAVINLEGQTKLDPNDLESIVQVNKGYLLMLIDEEGNLIGSQAITRDMKDRKEKAINSSLIFRSIDDKKASWLLLDEVPGNGRKTIMNARRVETDLANKTTESTPIKIDKTEIDYFNIGENAFLLSRDETEEEGVTVNEFTLTKLN